MNQIGWNAVKNERLKKVRGASFEELLGSKLIAVKNHPSREYQQVMLFEFKGYIGVVPFVIEQNEIFFEDALSEQKIHETLSKR